MVEQSLNSTYSGRSVSLVSGCPTSRDKDFSCMAQATKEGPRSSMNRGGRKVKNEKEEKRKKAVGGRECHDENV
ncbi:hypothetical protein AAE478_006239 [Parahypoxylon ruwenzoriense]